MICYHFIISFYRSRRPMFFIQYKISIILSAKLYISHAEHFSGLRPARQADPVWRGRNVQDGGQCKSLWFGLAGCVPDRCLCKFDTCMLVAFPQQTVRLFVSEEEMWASRGGYVPQWYPKCGFVGELCLAREDGSVLYLIAKLKHTGLISPKDWR